MITSYVKGSKINKANKKLEKQMDNNKEYEPMSNGSKYYK